MKFNFLLLFILCILPAWAIDSTYPTVSLEDKLHKHIHPDPSRQNLVGRIYIGDHEAMISEATWLYVKQALEYYKKIKPLFIILELDTPGGEVFAAQKISDALKEMDTQFDIPIVAFINNWAISAGAMLAYSSRYIFVVKDGTMGAAEPVQMGTSGKLEEASEKVNSAMRADFASRASFFDRNPLIAEAMVDKNMILVLRHGKIVKLDNENQIVTSGADADTVISPKGKLLTLRADQLLEYKVADTILQPEKLDPITTEEKEKGKWPLSKTLLSQIPFIKAIPQATIDDYQMDWKTKFFVFLASPLVSGLLFMGLLVGAYLEISNPGLSLPGTVAGICLFLIILSSLSLEIANWLEVILLITGLGIILVELFILPTFGLLGILGILLFLAGLLGMLLPEIRNIHFDFDSHALNAAGEYFVRRLAWLSGMLILSLIIIMILARYIAPSFSGFKPFVLMGHEQNGYIAVEAAASLPQPGEKGEVVATLRPTGKALIGDKIYDVMSTGELIDAGESIVVARVEGSSIFVNRAEGEKAV